MISIKKIKKELEKNKYIIISFTDTEHCIYQMHNICLLLGSKYTMFTMSGNDGKELETHTEMAYIKNNIQYFAIAVIDDKYIGGEFVLYDSKMATSLLTKRIKNIKSVEINIKSKNRQPSIKTKLIQNNGTLIFCNIKNIRIEKNKTGLTDKKLINEISKSITDSKILEVKVNKNEAIIVDNKQTLHSRKAFKGNRLSIRYRIDDPTLK